MVSTNELAVKVNSIHAQRMRQSLQDCGLWDSTRRLQQLCSNHVLIPVIDDVETRHLTITDDKHWRIDTGEQEGPCSYCAEYQGPTANHGDRQEAMAGPTSGHCTAPIKLGGMDGMVVRAALPPSKKTRLKTPCKRLRSNLERFITARGLPWTHELERDVPRHWESHGDLVLLPESSFTIPVWTANREMEGLWDLVAKSLGCKRLARKSRIQSDDYRTPSVELLLGEDAWVQHVDNGIRYCYDIQHCMFSAGNITEKLRVGAFNCQGETVVDLFAGIGYFTLPYLVHAGADFVHACEWNPHAVRALEKNLELNRVGERCQIHYGDNRKGCPRSVADRVNLGLIPSSEGSWLVACQALKPTGGMMHVHGNVESSRIVHQDRLSDSYKQAPAEASREESSIEANEHQECAGTEAENFSKLEQGSYPPMDSDSASSSCDPRLMECPNELESQFVGQRNVESPTELMRDGGVLTPVLMRGPKGSSGELSDPMLSRAEQRKCPEKCTAVDTLSSCQAGYASCSDIVEDPCDGHDISQVLSEGDASCLECGHQVTLQGLEEHSVNGCRPTARGRNVGNYREMDFSSEMSGTFISGSKQLRTEWVNWARYVEGEMRRLLEEVHKGSWSVRVAHIEHVKSYAPHVDHLVADVECTPSCESVHEKCGR